MKYLLIVLALLLGQGRIFAQSCQQIKLTTTPQKDALIRDYINDSRQKRYFFEDKGVVKLVIYQNDEGATCWHLSALIDDRYRTLPPEQYAFFDNDVILIYQGDKNGQLLPIAGEKNTRDVCIQDIVGSRVYECSKRKQFVYTKDANGKAQKIPVTQLSYGNLNNELIIKFNKDGTVSKYVPV